MKQNGSLADAIRAVGTAADLARKIGLTPQAVAQWTKVPAKRVIAVEEATGGKVSRYQLRPDLYPAESQETVGSP